MSATLRRTISPLAWSTATADNPSPIGEVNKVVAKVMAELYFDPPIPLRVDCHPWPHHSGSLLGAMWIGVPNVVSSWRDDEGCWIISPYKDEIGTSMSCLRLCPSLPENEVQYGFCPVKVDRMKMLVEGEFPTGEEPRVAKGMILSNAPTNGFRIDKMVMSAMSLFNPKDTTQSGTAFRRLLGKTSLANFISDMLRGLYTDARASQDITLDRDQTYGTMIYLVATRAYPKLMSPSGPGSWERFKTLAGKTGKANWSMERAQPFYYNVVMPQMLFEAASESLERGIPPLVPQYLTRRSWMFNGSCTDPCTGLDGIVGAGILGGKIIAGVVNRFNLDLPSLASYWPANMNPPDEWRAKVIECTEALRGMELPLDMKGRHDLVLQECRRIPVVRYYDQTAKFAIISKLGQNGACINVLETEECDVMGQALPTSSPSSEAPKCPTCSELMTLSDSSEDICSDCEVQVCHVCAGIRCPDCAEREE